MFGENCNPRAVGCDYGWTYLVDDPSLTLWVLGIIRPTCISAFFLPTSDCLCLSRCLEWCIIPVKSLYFDSLCVVRSGVVGVRVVVWISVIVVIAIITHIGIMHINNSTLSISVGIMKTRIAVCVVSNGIGARVSNISLAGQMHGCIQRGKWVCIRIRVRLFYQNIISMTITRIMLNLTVTFCLMLTSSLVLGLPPLTRLFMNHRIAW